MSEDRIYSVFFQQQKFERDATVWVSDGDLYLFRGITEGGSVPGEHAHNQPSLPLSNCLVWCFNVHAYSVCLCVCTNTHACLCGQMCAQRFCFKDNSFNEVFTPYLKQVFMKKMHKILTDRNNS